jgi:hypothetical protein
MTARISSARSLDRSCRDSYDEAVEEHDVQDGDRKRRDEARGGAPFGGMKESGVGREGGFDSLEFFTEAKNVCVKL